MKVFISLQVASRYIGKILESCIASGLSTIAMVIPNNEQSDTYHHVTEARLILV